jgi:hypothetical protein
MAGGGDAQGGGGGMHVHPVHPPWVRPWQQRLSTGLGHIRLEVVPTISTIRGLIRLVGTTPLSAGLGHIRLVPHGSLPVLATSG